jgi:hypothetical protein
MSNDLLAIELPAELQEQAAAVFEANPDSVYLYGSTDGNFFAPAQGNEFAHHLKSLDEGHYGFVISQGGHAFQIPNYDSLAEFQKAAKHMTLAALGHSAAADTWEQYRAGLTDKERELDVRERMLNQCQKELEEKAAALEARSKELALLEKAREEALYATGNVATGTRIIPDMAAEDQAEPKAKSKGK